MTSHSRIRSIPRDRLRLVRIVAPAGFGKSSLCRRRRHPPLPRIPRPDPARRPLHDFALAAAHLPWISADLMAAVSAAPVDVCRQRIFALVAAIGFLSEFDAAGEQRFRFHPLFQDALRSIAESHGPQHAQRRRAAAWFVARDDVDAGWLEYFAESPNLHAAIERMRSIYKKLGVHSRAEAVRVAREGGVGEQSRESG